MSPRVTVFTKPLPATARSVPTAVQKVKAPSLFPPPAGAASTSAVPSAFSRLRRGTAPPSTHVYISNPVPPLPIGPGPGPDVPVSLPDGTSYLRRGKLEPTPAFTSMPDALHQNYRSRLIAQLCELADKKPEYGIDKRTLATWTTERMHATLSGFTDAFKINSKVIKYKFWFMVMVVIIQLFFTHILGLNANGFANAQFRIIRSNRYDAILTEIGEKHSFVSVETGSPEIRLAMVVGLNLVIFIGLHLLGRFIAAKAGGGKLVIAMCEQAHGQLLDLVAPIDPTPRGGGGGESLPGLPSIQEPRDELADSQAFAKQCLNLGENFVNTLGITSGLFGGGGGTKKAPTVSVPSEPASVPPKKPTASTPALTKPAKPPAEFSRGAFKDE